MESKKELNSIAFRIKSRRRELGLSYQNVADMTNMSKSTLQRYENGGIKNIPLDKLNILSKTLDTTPQWILGIGNADDITKGSYEIFLKNLKYLMKYKGLGIEDVADMSYLPTVIINDIIKEKNILPSSKIISLISKAFGYTLADMLSDELDKKGYSEIIKKLKLVDENGIKKLNDYLDDLISSERYLR